jgi:hypothetical protein
VQCFGCYDKLLRTDFPPVSDDLILLDSHRLFTTTADANQGLSPGGKAFEIGAPPR